MGVTQIKQANTNVLFVAGKFDDEGGRPAKIPQIIYGGLSTGADYHNGGLFTDLERILDSVKKYNLIYWFPDVPNDKEKLIQSVKQINSACVLVTSKRNTESKYSFQDLIFHALGIKSNLFIEFTKAGEEYRGRVADPLGNVFLDTSEDFGLVGKVLSKRADELAGYQRVSSSSIGPGAEVPEQGQFFEVIKHYAETFHSLIHANPEATNRFFGNASFRCERGFPSFKAGDTIFVSERNIDKRHIDKTHFVGVQSGGLPVRFYGEKKPSVDTPIQLLLFGYYSQVKFMLHSHTYIAGAPLTGQIIPCGAVEEAEEIKRLFPDKNDVNFFINLQGHGSLALVDSVEHLLKLPYIARPSPEIHHGYAKGL